jgi:purine nucleosidase
MSEQRSILFDCDPGVDDAMAMLFHTGSGGRFTAIGSVHGNVPAPLGAANALRILDVAGVEDVPVAVGAHRPMAQPLSTAEFVHGDDGLGNTYPPESSRRLESISAAQQIVEAVHRQPGELTVVAVGPLTNLGLALLMDPELPGLVNDVVIMGGNVQLPGNATPYAEANIWHDPEAAALVTEAGWPVTFATLDATMQTVLQPRHLEALAGSDTASGQFVWAILQHYLDFYEAGLGVRSCPLHDPLAIGLALYPDLATYRTLPTRLELRGELTRGSMVCDLRPRAEAAHDEAGSADALPFWPVRYVDELDVERFQALFVESLT